LTIYRECSTVKWYSIERPKWPFPVGQAALSVAAVSITSTGSLAACAAFAAVGSLVAAADAIADYPVAGGQGLRYALATAVLLVLTRGRLPRLEPRELVFLAALAATGLVLFNVFVIAAVREGDAATVGVIVGCVPVVLAVGGPLLDGRRPSLRLVAAAAVVAAGAAAVEQAGGGLTAVGALLALGALACEACFSLLAVPVLQRLGALAVSTYACLLALPMLAAWALIADGAALPTPSAAEALALAHMALVVTAGGFLLWYTAVGLLGVERAGLFSGVLPVSALLCAAAIGAGEVTPGRLGAAVIVAAGITLGMRAGRTARA